jgi:hypothetical protein
MRIAKAISKLHPFLPHHRGCCQNHAEIDPPLASCYTRILASGIFGSECVKLFARDKFISKYRAATMMFSTAILSLAMRYALVTADNLWVIEKT